MCVRCSAGVRANSWTVLRPQLLSPHAQTRHAPARVRLTEIRVRASVMINQGADETPFCYVIILMVFCSIDFIDNPPILTTIIVKLWQANPFDLSTISNSLIRSKRLIGNIIRFRVFYSVFPETSEVHILAVGIKVRDRLFISGKEVKL